MTTKTRSQGAFALLAGLLLLLFTLPVWSATGTVLNGSTLYPRVVRLTHGPAAANGRLIASTNGSIFQSTNDGASWSPLGIVPTAGGSTERCCATLYELPQQVGSLAAGTLIFSASYFSGSTPAIEVYTSTNQGSSWTYHSTPIVVGDNSHGLWEPEFEVASDGALVMFWSDETDGCCSQKLAQIRTYNGSTWQDKTDTVRSTIQGDRPGMITVSKLPNGHFFMSYELCGPAGCTVFSRTSTDGWNFGDPTNMGTKVQTAAGQYLAHAPTNHWSPSPLSANGAILMSGQLVFESNNALSAQNGKVLFANTNVDGTGAWYTIAAPVQVPTAYDNFCPNYSSALLPSSDGSRILELASDYLNGGCITYFASEAWNQQTGLCLDDTGGSTTPGNLLTLWGCANNANQRWAFVDVGNGTYKLRSQASGMLVLDDPAASTTHGTQLQLWTNNGLPPQQWRLR